MFNVHTAQLNDQVLLEINGKQVTGIIDQIRPHTINWNVFLVFVTTDEPVKVWNDEDIRSGFCVNHNLKGNNNRVTKILA